MGDCTSPPFIFRHQLTTTNITKRHCTPQHYTRTYFQQTVAHCTPHSRITGPERGCLAEVVAGVLVEVEHLVGLPQTIPRPVVRLRDGQSLSGPSLSLFENFDEQQSNLHEPFHKFISSMNQSLEGLFPVFKVSIFIQEITKVYNFFKATAAHQDSINALHDFFIANNF